MLSKEVVILYATISSTRSLKVRASAFPVFSRSKLQIIVNILALLHYCGDTKFVFPRNI
jgi:hypothetical protein